MDALMSIDVLKKNANALSYQFLSLESYVLYQLSSLITDSAFSMGRVQMYYEYCVHI